MAARYAKLTGHEPRHLHYYEVFAGVRAAIVMARFADQMAAAGVVPPDAGMWANNPSTQLVARMLDLPAPTGASGSFIGHRSPAPDPPTR